MAIFLTMLLCGIGLLFISLWLGHDHDFDHGDAEHHGLGLLNTKVIGAFLMAFGAVGALARYQGHAMLPSSVWGTVGGAAFGGLMFGLLRLLWQQQASSHITTPEVVGHLARVTIAIPSDGVGQIELMIRETTITHVARAEDGVAIGAWAVVIITKFLGDIAQVRSASMAGLGGVPPSEGLGGSHD